jgi:hypothetical protein
LLSHFIFIDVVFSSLIFGKGKLIFFIRSLVIKIKFIPWREHRYYHTDTKLPNIFQQIAIHLKRYNMFRLGNIKVDIFYKKSYGYIITHSLSHFHYTFVTLLNHVVMDTTIRCTVVIVNVDNWLICVIYIYMYLRGQIHC